MSACGCRSHGLVDANLYPHLIPSSLHSHSYLAKWSRAEQSGEAQCSARLTLGGCEVDRPCMQSGECQAQQHAGGDTCECVQRSAPVLGSSRRQRSAGEHASCGLGGAQALSGESRGRGGGGTQARLYRQASTQAYAGTRTMSPHHHLAYSHPNTRTHVHKQGLRGSGQR